MIIGENKDVVIKNIENAVKEGRLNDKVEVNDPCLNSDEKKDIINKYLQNREKQIFKTKTKIAKTVVSMLTDILHKDTEIIGIENIMDITSGAIVTSNHFNPLDNLIIQKMAKEVANRRLYIVSQESNLAMSGIIGFFMNYSDTIPITDNVSYMKKEFPKIIKNTLKENNFILIYPEQEMWFNYKKPRNLKEGAYYFAAKNNVPVISCFVEMIETTEKENEDFNKVKYKLHILRPIYPDSKLTAKENSIIMRETDYKQKKEAYESIYGKELKYTFEEFDIAGWNKYI